MVVFHHVVDHFLRRGALLGGPAEDQLGELLLGDGNLVVVDVLVKEQLGAQRLGGTLIHLRPERVGVLRVLVLGLLQVGFDGQPGPRQLIGDLIAAGLELAGKHVNWHLEIDLREGGLQDLVPSLGYLLGLGLGQDRLGQVLAHLLDGVELGDQLGELVVQRGQFLLGHLRDGDRDVGLLAAEGTADQGGREGLRLPRLETANGLVESVEHPGFLADGEGDAGGGRLRQLLSILGSGQVDGEDVTLLGLAVEFRGGGEPLAEQRDALLHFVVERRQGVDRGLDCGEVWKVELGSDVDLGCELDEFTVLQFGDFDLGLGERNRLGLNHGRLVRGLDGLVDGLLEDHSPAETLVDDDGRHLALAESGDADLLCDLLVRLVEMGLEISEGDLYG